MPTGCSIVQPFASPYALDDFARDRGHRTRAQVAEQDVIGLREPEPHRVAIERRQAFDRRVVIELAARLRRLDRPLRADDLALQVPRERRAHARIEQALPRIDVVGGGQLAALALECRIIGEVDAGPNANGPGPAAVLDLRQRRRGARHALVRPREVVETVQRLEDRALHVVGVEVARRLRIESRLRHRKRDVQRLQHAARCAGCDGRRERRSTSTRRSATCSTARQRNGDPCALPLRPAAPSSIDVDVRERILIRRVVLVAAHPRLHEHVLVAKRRQHPRRIRVEELGHPAFELSAAPGRREARAPVRTAGRIPAA